MDFADIFIIGLAILVIVVMVCGIVFFIKNVENLEPVERKEEPHLYWKTIEAEVVLVNKKHWYASTHHYVLEVTVHNDEYDLTATLTENGSGAFAPTHWNLQDGDEINVILHSWKMESTGEIVRREIHAFAG